MSVTFLTNEDKKTIDSEINSLKSKTQQVATSTTAGVTKLYTSTGTSTDGTMTQQAIKSAIDSVYLSMPCGDPFTWDVTTEAPDFEEEGQVVKKMSSTMYPRSLTGQTITVTFKDAPSILMMIGESMESFPGHMYVYECVNLDSGEPAEGIGIACASSLIATAMGMPLSGTFLSVSSEIIPQVASIEVSAGGDVSYFVYMDSGNGDDAITWDGNKTGKIEIEGLVHVSEHEFSVDDCANGGTVTFGGVEVPFTIDNASLMEGMPAIMLEAGAPFVLSIPEAIASLAGFPAGIYFMYASDTQYVSRFSINGHTFSEKELKLDPKYLSILETHKSGGSDTFTWDGNTEGLLSVTNMYYLSSAFDVVNYLTPNGTTGNLSNVSGFTLTLSDGGVLTEGFLQEVCDDVIAFVVNAIETDMYALYFVQKDNVTFSVTDAITVTFPKAGLYALYATDTSSGTPVYMTSFTVDGYSGFDAKEEYKIKEEYLPDTSNTGVALYTTLVDYPVNYLYKDANCTEKISCAELISLAKSKMIYITMKGISGGDIDVFMYPNSFESMNGVGTVYCYSANSDGTASVAKFYSSEYTG